MHVRSLGSLVVKYNINKRLLYVLPLAQSRRPLYAPLSVVAAPSTPLTIKALVDPLHPSTTLATSYNG
jgi:hypothetical protein